MSTKLTREIVNNGVNSSFVLTPYSHAYFEAPFHFHPEYELILIEEGEGLSHVGDSVRPLRPGDFMLIGSNLAHLWLSDERYYQPGATEMSRSIYAQFGSNLLPANPESIPELHNINRLLLESGRGLIFTGDNVERFSQEFRDIVPLKGFRRWRAMLALLDNLGANADYRYLTTDAYDTKVNTWSDKIVERINQYIAVNYRREMTLSELADLVHRNPSSLCRYYKKATKMTMFDYLAKTRIEYSLKLLRSTSNTVADVALECGYNCMSHFYKQFKTVTGFSPTDYLENILKIKRPR